MKNYNKLIYDINDVGLIEESPEWWDHWDEEIFRCINGYEGLPGRYYFMLKFCKIKDIDRGWMRPWYLDFQHELIERIEYNDSIGRNTGVKKGRRKGYTYVAINAFVIYDLLFHKGIEMTWGVGDDETLNASRKNIGDCFGQVHPFFRLNTLEENKSLLQFGWQEPDNVKENKIGEIKGNLNILYSELMSMNTGVFKGKVIRRSIFEEIGKFKNLKQAFNDTKDAWMKGSKQIGTALLGGTGGAVDKGARDFMYMVNNPEEFNIDWFMIPAVKGYYPFVTGEKDGPKPNDIPGYSLVEEATVAWNQKEAALKKKQNKKSLYDFYQNNPMKDEHIFLTLGSGMFNQKLLEEAEKLIRVKPPVLTIGDFHMVKNWKEIYNTRGWCKQLVEFKPDTDGKSKIRFWPEDGNNDDISGCDPYTQEKSITSSSCGANYIYRVTSGNHMYDGDKICLEYFDRPEKIKTFCEQTLLQILFYGTTLNFEANQSAELVSFYEVKKAEHLLDLRPQSYDAVKDTESKASNKYGRSINVATKPLLVSSLASYVDEYYENLWSLGLINELKFFGSVNTDRAMALGIARLKALERYAIKGIDFIDQPDVDLSTDLPFFKMVDGRIVVVTKQQN